MTMIKFVKSGNSLPPAVRETPSHFIRFQDSEVGEDRGCKAVKD